MIDKDSATWIAVSHWAEGRLKSHRAALETIGVLTSEETAGVRYAINELKALLNMANPSKMQSNTEP